MAKTFVVWVRCNTLKIALWAVWAAAVVGTAFVQWWRDHANGMPVNTVTMVIRCLLVGVIGIVMVSNIEFWLEPDE